MAAATVPNLTTSDTVLVTGGAGFIGREIVAQLAAAGSPVRAAVRHPHRSFGPGVEVAAGVSLDPQYDWRGALARCRTVIHTSALVHQTQRRGAHAPNTYRRLNVHGTLRLARQAVDAGVRRFVFLSSIKVNGERTAPGAPFSPFDKPAPADPYALSKAEAERELAELAATAALEVVIIRPVLVYGPGVKGNFRSLLRQLARGLPLPFGAVHNRRSLVGVRNLVSLVLTCATHEAAANQTFLVSDGEDLSTTELLRRTARALGRDARLVSVPPAVLRALARATGNTDLVRRLVDSLQVDIGRTTRLLDWSPPVSVDEELSMTAQWFLAETAGNG